MKTQVYENTRVVENQELHSQEYKQIDRNLALTVRKEYRLTVVKNVTKTAIRMSWKTLLYVTFLMVANVII
jgi:hypothetical protein